MHILIKRHWLVDNFFMDAAGIEQMKSILMPRGHTNMGGIKSLLVGDDGNDVAVVDALTHEACVGDTRLRDITITLAVDVLL